MSWLKPILYLKALSTLIKELLVHLHEELEGVIDEAVDRLVPMVLATDRRKCEIRI